MKTTIDIPETLLLEVQRLSGARTRKQALITALSEYVTRRKMAGLVRHAGIFVPGEFLEQRDMARLRPPARAPRISKKRSRKQA